MSPKVSEELRSYAFFIRDDCTVFSLNSNYYRKYVLRRRPPPTVLKESSPLPWHIWKGVSMAQQPRGYGMALIKAPEQVFYKPIDQVREENENKETSHQFSLSIYFVASNARARSRSLGVSIPKPLYWVTITLILCPFSRARSCSRDSVSSSGLFGMVTNKSRNCRVNA